MHLGVLHAGNQTQADIHRPIGAVAVAVAVAIVSRERVLASLNVVFLSRAVTLAEAKQRYVSELQTAAREMVTALESESAPDRAKED